MQEFNAEEAKVQAQGDIGQGGNLNAAKAKAQARRKWWRGEIYQSSCGQLITLKDRWLQYIVAEIDKLQAREARSLIS